MNTYNGSADRLRKARGEAGEDLARRHLEEKGFRVVAKNWRCKEGEIDLIAEKDDLLVFVEVRTRRHTVHGSPLDTITGPKQRQVLRVAKRYLEQLPRPMAIRFDAVGVELSAEHPPRLSHIEGAFEDPQGW